MPLDISINAREIGLIDHGELVLFRLFFCGGGLRGGIWKDCDVEVEGALKDGGVRYGVDGVEGEEQEGFFEAVEEAKGEEEEEAWSKGMGK